MILGEEGERREGEERERERRGGEGGRGREDSSKQEHMHTFQTSIHVGTLCTSLDRDE